MRILGIDYGQKHIGLAVGNSEMKIAMPFKEIFTKRAIEELRQICAKESIQKIVLGLPLSFKMQETKASKTIRAFGDRLSQNLNIPVEYENEILTSTQIERETGKKSHAAAAVLILQSWLERH